MDPQLERRRFRSQYSDNQWSLLLANAEFEAAWESGNFVRAGELADPIVYGRANSLREARELKRQLQFGFPEVSALAFNTSREARDLKRQSDHSDRVQS